MVPSEGSVEVDDTERDLERRYHSSGTQNRKLRDTGVSEDLKGFVVKGVSIILESELVKGNLNGSGERP